MKKHFIFSGVIFTVTTLCLLFKDIDDGLAKSNVSIVNNHQKSSLVIRYDSLIVRRTLARWLTKIPKRSFNRWIDPDRGIYITKNGSIIGSYTALNSLSQQKRRSLLNVNNVAEKIEAHHLIEKRVARAFGFDENDIPAVLINMNQHRGKYGIHNRIYKILPRGNRKTGRIAYKGKLARIQQAYQEAYKEHDDWLDAITAIMSEWHSRP